MKLKYECGRVLIIPETAVEGMHVGAFFGSLPEKAREAVWMNAAQEHIGLDVVQLSIVDDMLGWKGTGSSRVDRLKALLELEFEAATKGLKDTPPAPWIPKLSEIENARDLENHGVG